MRCYYSILIVPKEIFSFLHQRHGSIFSSLSNLSSRNIMTTTTTTTTTTSPSFRCVWTNLTSEIQEDPEYGKPLGRSSHGLSYCAAHGKLFLYGGENIARTPLEPPQCQSSWILDIAKKQWKFVGMHDQDQQSNNNNNNNNNSSSPSPRVAHAQAVHANGKDVYVFGGRAGITMSEQPLQDLWKFDMDTESWTSLHDAKGDLPEARSFHKMISTGDALYVFGGCGPSGRLADLHKYHIPTHTWTTLSKSTLLRGRGGPNLFVLPHSSKLAVIAGFAGEETNDGHIYNLSTHAWDNTALHLKDMRPRSVCASGCMPSLANHIVIFGGEVDPSDRGHEGAGGFANDLVIVDPEASHVVGNLAASTTAAAAAWPVSRGWSDAAIHPTQSKLYVFGGLTGDDEDPQRLEDLWQCELSMIEDGSTTP